MQYSIALASLLALASASPLARRQLAAVNTPLTTDPNINNEAFIQSLVLAASAVDRVNLLAPADLVYDFGKAQTNSTDTTGAGGHTVKADRKAFPALIGNGVSMTVGFLGPCGFNTPHTHPRSAEFNIVVQGALVSQFMLENGAHNIVNNLTLYQATVFPQGALHTEFNPLCTNSTFVAGFGNEDPGVQQAAQVFYGFQEDIVQATLEVDTINGEDIEAFKSKIPANVALGVESCLSACGIQKK
ncbi:hypothetical protein MMC25_003605 [Agyrium rufum]|nr:hypothetical protein [Agyrium rufum]